MWLSLDVLLLCILLHRFIENKYNNDGH